ncbi:MAG: hypothetical protein AAGA50_16695 [Pseudomonadota bacterium]
MANIEDITGWREELYEFNEYGSEEEHKQFYGKYNNGIPPDAKLSQVLELVEVLLKHDETREALKKMSVWEKIKSANEYDFLEDNPKFKERPDDAIDLIIDFFDWFCWKQGYDWAAFGFLNASYSTSIRILDGELPDVRSHTTVDHVLERYKRTLVDDREGKIT